MADKNKKESKNKEQEAKKEIERKIALIKGKLKDPNLPVEEKNSLKEELKNLQDMLDQPSAEGQIKRNPDEAEEDDKEAGKFSEKDISQYMYDQLLNFGSWLGEKTKKYIVTACKHIEREYLFRKSLTALEKSPNNKTKAKKIQVNLHDIINKRNDMINSRVAERSDDIQAIAKLALTGKLTKENTTEFQKLLHYRGINETAYETDEQHKDLRKMVSLSTNLPKTKEDVIQEMSKWPEYLGKNEEIEKLREDPQAFQKALNDLKENDTTTYEKIGGATYSSQLHDLQKAVLDFEKKEQRKNKYEASAEIISNFQIEAQMLDKISRDSKAYNDTNLEDTFKSKQGDNLGKINDAIVDEKQNYIEGSQNNYPRLNGYLSMAKKADQQAATFIANDMVKEKGEKTPENIFLKELNEAITNKRDTQQSIYETDINEECSQHSETLEEAGKEHKSNAERWKNFKDYCAEKGKCFAQNTRTVLHNTQQKIDKTWNNIRNYFER